MTRKLIVADAEGAAAVPEVIKERWDWVEWFFETNGTAALTRLRMVSPALLIVNLQLPDISGLELVERVRKGRPHLPVVMTDNRPSALSEGLARTHGIVAFLSKPLLPEALEPVLACVLREVGRVAGRPVESDKVGGE